MSDNVPFEIQEEIIKHLPVKSLIRFRSVSKSWKSLIDSSDFITHYSSQQQHLLVYNYLSVDHPNCVSIVDDNTFPQDRVPLTLPLFVKMLRRYRQIGSSHGLLCLYNDRKLVIWNPLIRKAVVVIVPNVVDDMMFQTVLGFGVCIESSDPKIVKIRHSNRFTNMESVNYIPWQVEIFTLSTGVWRSLNSSNLPRKSIILESEDGVCVDGVYYWLATDRSTVDAEIEAYNMIISFDMTSEEFGEANLLDNFVYETSMWDLHLYNLRESLVLVKGIVGMVNAVYSVWMIQDGVPKSFTKLFTFHSPDATILKIHEFRKSGELVMEVIDDDRKARSLVVYERNLKHISNLGISRETHNVGIYVHSYMETLLLLDQPSLTIFGNGKRVFKKLI
ncbi:putative F-box domain-containing protein [Helianthus annuus]|uniref:F-box domain-containing protein n=1 Tax=Helianthus annuus TaxID=4232 RepID=A0A9K3DWE4_HELAN|nr:putative F-box domain-containing protein [Helianthus annuus]KAJ0647124.1 putative F-box domain-containing protein [Helianthus annuus]KAJ0842856.1 putative F-box domain-containing protein [Helianthus annuus]KAJ0842861.1 putative F-box domain-containing protein [Helianthus annuus]